MSFFFMVNPFLLVTLQSLLLIIVEFKMSNHFKTLTNSTTVDPFDSTKIAAPTQNLIQPHLNSSSIALSPTALTSLINALKSIPFTVLAPLRFVDRSLKSALTLWGFVFSALLFSSVAYADINSPTYDNELNLIYKKVIQSSDKDFALVIKKSQRIWLKARNESCELFKGGKNNDMDSDLSTDCISIENQARIKFLESLI